MKYRSRKITAGDLDSLMDDPKNQDLLMKKMQEIYQEMVQNGEIPSHQVSTSFLQKLSLIEGS